VVIAVHLSISSSIVMWKSPADGNFAPSPAFTVKEVAISVISAARAEAARFLIFRYGVIYLLVIILHYITEQ